MTVLHAGPLAAIPDGSMTERRVGDDRVVVCRLGNEVYALDGTCPHRGGPLAEGALHGKMVVCPWHAWEFDCITGEHDYNPEIRQKTYRTGKDGGEILIEIPDA